MSGDRSNQERRDRALGALAASAVEVDGELVPNFLATSRSLGVPRQSLQKWWKARDKNKDAQLRASVTRAREQVAQEGAEVFLRDLSEGIRRIAMYMIDSKHYGEGGVRVDHAAKTLAILLASEERLRSVLTGTAQASAHRDPLTEAREALARTRLLRQLGGGGEGG